MTVVKSWEILSVAILGYWCFWSAVDCVLTSIRRHICVYNTTAAAYMYDRRVQTVELFEYLLLCLLSIFRYWTARGGSIVCLLCRRLEVKFSMWCGDDWKCWPHPRHFDGRATSIPYIGNCLGRQFLIEMTNCPGRAFCSAIRNVHSSASERASAISPVMRNGAPWTIASSKVSFAGQSMAYTWLGHRR